MTPDSMVSKVDDALNAGIRAIKIRMDCGPHRRDSDPAKAVAMFTAVGKLVGDDILLSFDANNGYSVSTGIRQRCQFEAINIYHFDEPVAQYDYTGIKQVADALDVPV